MRSERPGAFCAYSSLICLAVGYLGTMVTALGLLYYTVVGSFVMPALVKVMAGHPELSKVLSQICGNSAADIVDARIDEESISRRRGVSESQDSTTEQSSSPLARYGHYPCFEHFLLFNGIRQRHNFVIASL